MTRFIMSLLALTTMSAAPGPQTFTGAIFDQICADGGHAQMQMGPTDAACARACVEEHGATYVLLDGTTIYELSDQKAAEKLAGQKVRVTGTLDPGTHTIHVDSIRLQ